MPMMIVTIIPPGSLPGITNLAMAPAIKPRKIQERIPIFGGYRESRVDIKLKEARLLGDGRDPRISEGGVGDRVDDPDFGSLFIKML